MIGAPCLDTVGANDDGVVHVYDGTTYELLHTLTNPHPEPVNNNQFGVSMSALGDNLLIGGGRSAYVFDPATGSLLLDLVDFGIIHKVRVSAVGDDILVGALYDKTDAFFAGRAYLFDGTSGDLKLTIPNPTPDEFKYFGISVAGLDNGNLAVGAPYDDTFGDHSGKVYIFQGVPAEVPEPGSLFLLTMAGMCLGWRHRRSSAGKGRRRSPVAPPTVRVYNRPGQGQHDALGPGSTATTMAEPRDHDAGRTVVLHLLDSACGRPLQTWRFSDRTEITIGRSDGNDVVVIDPHVSRLHVKLVEQHGSWRLYSVGRHGTLIGSQPVAEFSLRQRAVFRLGPLGPMMRFENCNRPVGAGG